jgi:hypothetical protein
MAILATHIIGLLLYGIGCSPGCSIVFERYFMDGFPAGFMRKCDITQITFITGKKKDIWFKDAYELMLQCVPRHKFLPFD